MVSAKPVVSSLWSDLRWKLSKDLARAFSNQIVILSIEPQIRFNLDRANNILSTFQRLESFSHGYI